MTPLVAFDRVPLDAQAAAARTALAAAQRGVERAKRLVDAGIAPRKDLDQAANDLARANADAIAAERHAVAGNARGAHLGRGDDDERGARRHGGPAQTLVEVADLSALDSAHARAAQMPRHACIAAQSVDMRRAQSGDAEALGTATVADIGGTIDSTARAVVVRAPITHPHTAAAHRRDGVRADRARRARERGRRCRPRRWCPRVRGSRCSCVDAERVAHATPVTVGVRNGRVRRDHVGAARRRDGGDVRRVRRRGQRQGSRGSRSAAGTGIPLGTPKP